jgi:hypothetical protein
MSDDTLRLVYEGGGRFRVASTYDLEAIEMQFTAGEAVEMKPAKGRSVRQHRWLFNLIAEAYANQRGGPDCGDAERLRKWLLIRVGHCHVKRFDPRAITKPVAAWLKQTYDDLDFTTDGRWIYAKRAKSVAFRNCDHETACKLGDAIVDVVCAEIVPGSSRADWEPYLTEGRHAARRSAARKRKPVEKADATLHG